MVTVSERVQACSTLLQSLSLHLDRVSDFEALPANSAETQTMTEALMALHGVLAGADAVLALEVRRWGL